MTTNAEQMTSSAVNEESSRPLLTLGRLDRVRVQVGYRLSPEDPAHDHFMLDLAIPDPDEAGARDALDENRILAALEPAVYTGAGAPRHYSLHQHRWHTSWGPSPAALEIGLLVTTGIRTAAVAEAALDSVTRAFRDLLELAGPPQPSTATREAALLRARRSVAAAYALDPDGLTVSTEMHHPAANSWRIGLRTPARENYDVVVGLVDGYPGSVRVRHHERIEALDSVGSS
jgi:hypothetical protein